LLFSVYFTSPRLVVQCVLNFPTPCVRLYSVYFTSPRHVFSAHFTSPRLVVQCVLNFPTPCFPVWRVFYFPTPCVQRVFYFPMPRVQCVFFPNVYLLFRDMCSMFIVRPNAMCWCIHAFHFPKKCVQCHVMEIIIFHSSNIYFHYHSIKINPVFITLYLICEILLLRLMICLCYHWLLTFLTIFNI
jgi:hypothetical protein